MVMSKEWIQYCATVPWVCCIKTYNSGPTIYACLKHAAKTFKHIVVTDDGSTDETLAEVKRYSDENPGPTKISYYDVAEWDPIPSLILKRDHGNTIDTHPVTKTHSKAQIKSLEVCRNIYPESLYFSLEDDVILYDNIRDRIFDRISRWSDPDTDCEYFNLANIINREYVRVGIHNPGMKRRKLYENAGDWTFCCIKTSGKISFGPDPVNPWGACMYPWLAKNQTGKKGQDMDLPYGNHLIYYRRTRDGFKIEDSKNRVVTFHEIADDNINNDCFLQDDFLIDLKVEKLTGRISINEKKLC
jgi:glycosyltransferase involved in cell wall biosynthesis